MSLNKVKEVFENLQTCDMWSLQLLQIKSSKRNGTSYTAREILLSPEGALTNFVLEIAELYLAERKGVLQSFECVTDYDASAIANTVYKLEINDELISEEYSALIEATASPNVEIAPLEFGAQAYLLQGRIVADGEEKSVKLISMQSPITSLKHKFLHANGTFQEITEKVISLRTTIDVIIVDGVVYMLTPAGENLFQMERAYKSVCAGKLQNIEEYDMVTDFGAFSCAAGSGHNPRKFVSFQDNYLQKLRDVGERRRMATKFRIPMEGDKFDTAQPQTTDKLVKLLCARGMVEPFEEEPMEVAGSKRWQ